MFLKKIILLVLTSTTLAHAEPTNTHQLPSTTNQTDEKNTLTKHIFDNNAENKQTSLQQTEINNSTDNLTLETTSEQDAVTLRGPKNESFSNARVYNTLQTKDLYVEGNTVIGANLKINKNTVINGNLTVDGTISGGGSISGPGLSTVNAVARFSNATGSAITDSPVLIDNAGNISGVNDLTITGDINGPINITMAGGDLTGVQDISMSGDLTGVNNLAMSGDLTGIQNATMTGDLTGVTNITLAGGDVTGLNNLSMTGDLTGLQNVTMTGDIVGATTITMSGGNLTGVQDITMTGTLTGIQDASITNNLTVGNNITASGVIAAQDLSSSGTLLISAIANINSPSAVVTWPTIVGAAGTFLESDGAGNLVFSTPAGAGDVSAAVNFTTNNRVVLTDTPNGSKNVKESANVVIDGSDNISGVATLGATTINATTVNAPTLNGNATTATNALNVGTQTALQVQTATIAANNATNSGIANRIVLRDGVGSGGFTAGKIIATEFSGPLTGNATSATYSTTAVSAGSFSGLLGGDVTGPQNSTIVGSINNGAMSAGTIITGVNLANNSTSLNTLGTIVRRNPTDGGFTAGPITASLVGNANTATLAQRALRSDYAWSFTGQLAGDVTGPQSATVVAFVNGVPASSIAAGSTLASTATWFNTPNTLVLRDGSGNFSAGTITASLNGNATTATTAASATNFTGSLLGDVVGLQSTTTVLTVGGKTRVEIAASVNDTQAATPNNTPADFGKIVRRDASGNFSATTITANITGNVSGSAGTAGFATTAGTASNFSGSLAGDVGGTQSTTVVNSVGGQSATAIAFTTTTVSARTDANTPSTLVFRNGSGNFSGGTITAVTGFSGNLTGNVNGIVTGSLVGNATSATSSTTAQWFSQNLAGDVTGPQLATFINTIQGTSAATVLAGAALANSATDASTPSFIVKRDASGNFITNMITLNGAVSADTDAATKAYVDSVAGTGIEPKTPVLATSIIQTPTSGLATPIDGVTLSAADRVLLTQQSYQIDNGIWLAQSLDWTRPTDFALGTTAGQAYVLTTSGLTLAGTGWLCSTPLATIGTDTVTFIQFTSAGQTGAANLGGGVGIFKDKTGLTLNFKTLVEGAGSEFITIAPQGANEVSFGITATSDATPLTLVARDASGAFAGTLVGTATGNLPLTGGTLTGNLIMANESEIRWAQDSGSNYVGFKAPSGLSTFYTVDLPANVPTTGQFLQVLNGGTSAILTWTLVNALPAATETIYVSLSGDDANSGSFSAPLRHIKTAVTMANGLASAATPIAINVGAGTFVEDNSTPILLTADGISIIGSSMSTTIVSPSTFPGSPLFSITTPNFEFSNFTLDAGAAGASNIGIDVTTNNPGVGRFNSIVTYRFATGFDLNSAAGVPIILFENIQPRGNTTAMSVNSIRVVIKDSIFLGPTSGNTPANTAISIGGSTSLVTLLSTSFRALVTGITTSDAKTRLIGCNFENTENGLVCSGASNTSACSCNFTSTSATTIDVAASGASAVVNLTGCHFQGSDNPLAPMGTAIKVTNGANLTINSSLIENTDLALVSGAPGEVNSSSLKAGGVYLVATTTDVQQNALAAVRFIGGVFDSDRILINNPTNVQFAAFDRNFITGETTLSIGDTTDTPQDIYEILTGQPSRPTLSYESDYYGFKGTSYINTNTNPTFNGVQSNQNDARYFVVTGDRTKEAGISLISDTGNFGNPDNVRGWTINKLGSQADLAFTFTNNDATALALRGPYNVMQLNGLDNQVEFPVATGGTLPVNDTAKLVWAGENATTNLYRPNGTPNTLKTDAFLVVSTLATPTGLVHSDSNGLLSSSLLVNADVSATASIVDTKLATIVTAGKVANSATTATSANNPNTIVLRNGSGNFDANTITATLTGSASLNVLKAGDTMTGNLIMANESAIRWAQNSGSNYVGFKAPSGLSSPYTVALPTQAPTSGQFLVALDSSSLTWTSPNIQPEATRIISVSTSGSDLTGDGSFTSPFLTVNKAVDFATNVLFVTFFTPVVIQVGPGFYPEINPINITADGITIQGDSLTSTYILPAVPSANLFHVETPFVEFTNFTIDGSSGPSTASGLDFAISLTGYPLVNSVAISAFQTGISAFSSTGTPVLLLNNLLFNGNATAISINGLQAVIKSSLFQGPSVLGDPATNVGITITGAQANVALLSDFFTTFTTAVSATNSAQVRALGGNIEHTINGFICTNNSKVQLVGFNFILNTPTSINVAIADSGTKAYLEGCLFDLENALEASQGTALKITNAAEMFANACTIEQGIIGIECGAPGDTSATLIKASGISIIETATSIRQKGSSTVQFVGGALDINTLDIADPTNVDFAGFNANGESHLAIGKIQDVSSIMYEVLNGQASIPALSYKPNYYGHKGTVYKNANDNPTFNATQSDLNDASYYVVTGKNYKEACLHLISDSNNIGDAGNVRGWSICKTPTTAELAFTFTNNDPDQPARGPYTVMQLNGFDNRVEFPTATGTLPTNETAKLMWGGEASTNLYRPTGTPNTLKTDANFIVGGALTAGSTFISTLTVGAGTAANPSLRFAGSTNTGLSAQTPNRLSFDTLGVERMSISSTGTVSINEFTVAGVVHNNSSGQLSSSLIVNADIAANAAIADTKLAVISTAGKVANSATTATSALLPNTIVLRDGSGNFLANVITATLSGNATSATSALSAITSTTSTYFIGQLFGDVTGLQSTTSVAAVGGKTATAVAAAVTDVQLSTTVNTPNTLVRRGTTGNFAAGMITASLTGMVTGTASFNVLKIGDTMTGSLTLPPGTTAAPSLNFTGGTTTGISMPSTNQLSFDTAGVERMSIESTGTVNVFGTLVLAAGTAAQPSLKFTNGTNTGFSSQTADQLSFDTAGVERMSILPTGTIVANAGFVFANTMAQGAIQFDASATITVASTISTLILNRTTATTINWPAPTMQGQLFTMVLATSSTFNLTNNVTAPATTIVNEITNFNLTNTYQAPRARCSATYIYYGTTWYLCGRG